MDDIVRFEKDFLRKYFPAPESRPCEQCNIAMASHEWVDLDQEGFAVNCSNKEKSAS